MLARSGRWASRGPCQQIPHMPPLSRPRPSPKFILVTRMMTPWSTGRAREFQGRGQALQVQQVLPVLFPLCSWERATGCAAMGARAFLPPPTLLPALRAGLGAGIAHTAWAGAEALALLGP